MTNEEMRIAIAGALRWRNVHNSYRFDGIVGISPNTGYTSPIPNYPEDLNACYEMEKSLTDTVENDEWSKYCIALNSIACQLKCKQINTCGYTVSATPRQRCEAFLRVKGLWKEESK